jgi:hypothetical protein
MRGVVGPADEEGSVRPLGQIHRKLTREARPVDHRRRRATRERPEYQRTRRRQHRERYPVRTHLNRPVVAIFEAPPAHQGSSAARCSMLYPRRSNPCKVTSLVPSGNVASTCTWSSIPDTSSVTSSRFNTCRPSLIRSATRRPRRVHSSTQDVSTAITSAQLRGSPRSRRAQARPAAE